MKKYLIGLSLMSAVVLANGSNPPEERDPVPEHRKPASNAKVYYAKNGWEIKSANDLPKFGRVSRNGGTIVWDLQGGIIDGKNQKGSGGQEDGQEVLFKARVALLIKNGFIRNNKDGATFLAANSGMEKVTFTNIGEDAVVFTGDAENGRVIDCEFINDKKTADKSIQMSEAKNGLIKGNLIYGGIHSVRVGQREKTKVTDRVVVEENNFVGMEKAVDASAITLFFRNNKGNDLIYTSHGAKVVRE